MIQQLTKCDSATRQLTAAIRLYFQDADPLAIHTIAGAAHGLLRDLLARKAASSSDHAQASSEQSEQVGFVSRMVDQAKNFLKHADRNPEMVLTFNTDWTDF